jgi:hypothetical protein
LYNIKGDALSGRPVYLDFQATTPMDPRVLDKMMPFMMEKYGFSVTPVDWFYYLNGYVQKSAQQDA